MRELSLHILDISENSLAAGATCLEIEIIEDTRKDILEITVRDNGKGMTPEEIEKVEDPFFTTRTTRKVGLGIPLFKANALSCNGEFKITSNKGIGTKIYASFQHSHIDRVPLGDLVSTLISIIVSKPDLNLLFKYNFNGREFIFDVETIREKLDDIPITNSLILDWIRGFLQENIEKVKNPPA